MKYSIVIIIFFFFILFIFKTDNIKNSDNRESKVKEVRGIFISYIDYKNKFISDDVAKKEIDSMINNVADNKFNLIILQVRSFSDALYESEIFPKASDVNCSFDILDYFIKQAHKKGVLIYAWVNPYRISTNTDINKIDKSNPAYSLLNTNNVKVIPEKGIYYNPATTKVQDLIKKGVLEIVDNYEVDGVCFDDYFYPDTTIDQEEYTEYLKTNPGISLRDFHIMNVNNLISNIYKEIKSKKKTVEFGISPDGNIDNNYITHGADVKRWTSVAGYIDFIMPQIYYGFNNEVKPYIDTVKQWNKLIVLNSVKLIPALALYKSGNVDQYAKNGKMEWIENDDILKKQIIIGRNLTHYAGFAIFRYDYMFNKSNQTNQVLSEIENIKKIID